MNPSLIVIRAVAAEFARRIFKPLVIAAVIISILLIVVMSWLVAMSAWWWLLAVPVFAGIVIGSVILVIAGIIIRVISPTQNKSQKRQVAAFVDRIQRLSEITQTPKVVLLYRAVRDVVAPSKSGFIQSVVTDTTSIRKEYKDLLDSFSG